MQEVQSPRVNENEQAIIEDVETLKVLADPLRMRIVSECELAPRTVKELAHLLDVPATRLYYHVKLLESRQLIRVFRTRMVSGIEERTYRTTARGWTVSAELASQMAGTGVLKAFLDMIRSEIEVALSQETPLGGPEGGVQQLAMTRWHLSPDELAEVMETFDVLNRKYGDSKPRADTREYHALFTIYRRFGAD
jgi:hypothetical protein